jgi:hypothetical protein
VGPILLAVSCGGLRSVAITRAPRFANASAIAWPMPWPAPVTNATRPSCVLIGIFILPCSPAARLEMLRLAYLTLCFVSLTNVIYAATHSFANSSAKPL